MKVNDSKITINIHKTKHEIIIFLTPVALFCRHVNKINFYPADRSRRKEMLIQIFKHRTYMSCCHLPYLRCCVLALLRYGDVNTIFQKILSNTRTSHLLYLQLSLNLENPVRSVESQNTPSQHIRVISRRENVV